MRNIMKIPDDIEKAMIDALHLEILREIVLETTSLTEEDLKDYSAEDLQNIVDAGIIEKIIQISESRK